MRKKTGLYIRVPEEWLGRVRVEAGACGEGVSEYVRGAVEMRMEGGEVGKIELREVPLKEIKKGVVVVQEVEEAGVPAWKAKLEAQLAEREKRGFSVLPGETAPESVSTPRYVPFEQSEEERAKKMALLRSAATGMKMQPQMPPKTEFYPDDEPNEENT